MVAGLLFLAFAYLAVGQAAANRNGAQTAADAAALAAAQDTRDQLADLWVLNVKDPTKWSDIFHGIAAGLTPSCWRAYDLAEQNDAGVDSCQQDGLRFTVGVRTDKTVGDSIVPGTENVRSKATASAEIEPLCTFEPPAEDPEDPEDAEDAEDGEGTEDDVLPQLSCDNGNWTPDPDHPADLPKPQDLFRVHLVD